MAYLNVEEIESAIIALSAAYPGAAELITLPNATVEGRSCHLVRIGSGPEANRPGVLILGGVHAREWVPPDLCVSFAADLLEAHDRGTGLGYGPQYYSAEQVRSIISGLNVFVFPDVNPDGRHYSQTAEPLWRKNRNAVESAGNPVCVGVDLNRNFDFLWDFENRFSPSALVSTSNAPCSMSQTYRGSAPASEPECQNVVHMLDAHPAIGWLVDVHSYGELILHSWGDDQNQSDNPAMTFANAQFDSLRGVENDDRYREFVPIDDLQFVQTVCQRAAQAIKTVRGRDYQLGQAFGLYATSGASDDYAYARHFVDASRSKVYGFTIECGTEFQPPWSEAEHIITEVSAGLFAFCLEVLARS